MDLSPGAGAIIWQEFPGKTVTVRTPVGGNAVGVAAQELRAAERVVAALTEFLRPEGDSVHVEIYLVEPVASDRPGDPGEGMAPAGGIGPNGIVRVVSPTGREQSIAQPLTRFLISRWFGDDAATARPFMEGVAGLMAARADLGPGPEEADAWAREQLAAGGHISVVAPATPSGAHAMGQGPAPMGGPPMGGPPMGGPPMGRPAAGPSRTSGSAALGPISFMAYLVEHFGAESIRKFFAGYQAARRDEAAIAVFQRPVAALDEAWQSHLKRSQRGQSVRTLVRYLLPLLAPHRLRYAELVGYQLFAALVGVVLPVVSGCVIQGLGRPAGAPEPGGLCGTIAEPLTSSRLALIALALAVLYFVDALVTIRRAKVENLIFRGIGITLQERMFDRLQRLSHRFYSEARVGELTARLTGDARLLDISMSMLLGNGLLNTIILVVTAVTVFATSPWVGAVVVVILPVFVVARRLLGGRIAKAIAQAQQLNAEVNAVAQENLSAHAVVKAFGLEERANAAFGAQLRATLAATMRMSRSTQLLDTSLNLGSSFTQLAVIAVGGTLVLNGTISDAGKLVTLLGLVLRMVGPLSVLSTIEKSLQQAGVAVQRINGILEEPIEIEDRPGARAVPPLSSEIRLEGVTFSYGGGKPILRDLDLVIPAGTSVAVVGPSGSGKSTLLNLLLRFWDPDSGRVLFDGVDLRDATLASIRGQIGLVFQETFVFNTTLRDNIAIGRLDATDAEVEAAARAARLDTYVETLPAGFDTVLGERGVRMSGGQRQRLAIARALLRDPPLLVLDEATSALDARTESEILDTLAAITRTRTTFTITHRLSMAAVADMVVVLDQGRLVEQGTHAELVHAGGLYQRLYEEQTDHVTVPGAPPLGLEAVRLRRIPLFANLAADALADLAERLAVEHFDEGEDLVRQGEPADKLYVIGHGETDVLVADDGGERRVNGMGERDYFGELALLSGQPRSATVRAASDTEAYTLSRADFLALVEREPAVRRELAKLIGGRRAAYDAAALAAGITAAEQRGLR